MGGRGGHGPGMAMGGRGGECGDPSQELLEVAERKWAAALVEEDGRKSVKRVEWRNWRHGHFTSHPTSKLECSRVAAGRGQPRTRTFPLRVGKGP